MSTDIEDYEEEAKWIVDIKKSLMASSGFITKVIFILLITFKVVNMTKLIEDQYIVILFMCGVTYAIMNLAAKIGHPSIHMKKRT